MTTATTLRMCFATQESGADAHTDFTTLTVNFTQLTLPDFFPKRTVAGATQHLNVTAATSNRSVAWAATGDQILWTQAANCESVGGAATATLAPAAAAADSPPFFVLAGWCPC